MDPEGLTVNGQLLLSFEAEDGFSGLAKSAPPHFAVRVSRADFQLTWTCTCWDYM